MQQHVDRVSENEDVFLVACAVLTLLGIALRWTELMGLWGGA